MLISISPEIIRALIENKLTEDQTNYLTKSLVAVMESDRNMLVMKENITANNDYYKLIKNDNIDRRLRSVIIELTKEFKYTSNMFEDVNRYIEITFDKTEFITEDSKGILFLGIDYIVDKQLEIQYPIKILGEDQSDSEFYKKLANLYDSSIYPQKRYYDSLEYKIGSGGGGTIDTMLVTEVFTNKEITVAIVDSDKKYDNDDYGDTAKNLIKGAEELENIKNYHYEKIILEFHEKENLIKPSEYFKNGVKCQFINEYCQIENNGDLKHYLKYIDYKSGLQKNYHKLKDEGRNFYSVLEHRWLDFKSFNMGRKCMDCVDVFNLDLESDDEIVKYRKEISKIFWSWGISKKANYLYIN